MVKEKVLIMITYIDLFCGIGGFRQGIERVCKNINEDSKCIFACDKDIHAAKIYRLNYGEDVFYDLKSSTTHDLIEKRMCTLTKNKELDFIFAGFPCQSFSKAGNQEGFKDEEKGNLFFEIIKIAKKYHPKFMLLENVRNLKSHDGGNTWKQINYHLKKSGYHVDHVVLSPNQIPNKKIPALRDRVFILCYRNDLFYKNIYVFNDKKLDRVKTSIYTYGKNGKKLNSKYFEDDQQHYLDEHTIKTLEMWDDFRNRILENGGKMISPIWPHYFSDFNISDKPLWKQMIINRNREFYKKHKDVIDKWKRDYAKHLDSLIKSDKKLEWNAGEKLESIFDGIIQFRPSGVRVKAPTDIPTLVAINQTPIIGFEKRYMTPEEIRKLYGFKKLKFTNQPEKQTYKQLGNTVSVDVIEYLITHMVEANNI